MAKNILTSSKSLFFILSLIIATLDITFVKLAYVQSETALISSFEKDVQNQHAGFLNAYNETINNMLQLATFVANDPRIQQAFLQGKKAVEAEGNNGKGKEQAKIARDRLFAIVSPSWSEMTKRFKARQLHFHLGPGSNSFLRVHKPAKFGDNMDHVRHTIVDANTFLKATSGFETGRVYSGIRGVQPVFAIDPDSEKKVHVGAVESGISYHSLLNNVAQTYQLNIVVLLTMEHIKANVWPDLLNQRLEKSPPFDRYVIEIDKSNKAKNLQYFERINTSGERLLCFLNDLLDLSKLESGKQTYNFERVDLMDLINTVKDELSIKMMDKDLQLIITPPYLSSIICCDPLKITQIINNLLSNAIKFSPEGKTICLSLVSTNFNPSFDY